MASSGEYSGIQEAVQNVLTKKKYDDPCNMLSDIPSEATIIQWTGTLTGFEAGATVTREEKEHLDAIESLYFQSRSALERHASELGVLPLNEFPPKDVLFMVNIRDLQDAHAGRANLNPP